jgi:hypothetical protein
MLSGFASPIISRLTRLSHDMQDRCPTCHRRYKRSTQANAMYWALLHRMAARCLAGKQYSVEAFHLYYASRFLGCDDVTLPNKVTLTIPRSTSALDVDEFGKYLDQVQADCAERGVYLEDLND